MSADLLAAAQILSKPINDIYELGKDKFKNEMARFKAISNIKSIYKTLLSVQKVKTIWQIDKAVNLRSFYYPSSLLVDGRTIKPNSIKKIPCQGNLVLQGIVGQGKSIFLRYLCIQEIKIGENLPVFLELRKVDENESITENVIKVLDSYGLNCSEDIFEFLCSTGKISLLLDGFDEIKKGQVTKAIRELELLSEKHKSLKIIITSRPDSGIEKSPSFTVLKLVNLNESDIHPLISKITESPAQAKDLSAAVLENNTNIKHLLTTPLMVTLLVMIYKSEQKIPSQLSEFYENLFPLLLYRHDKSKPGYTRERSTKLNERKLQQVFEALCFQTRKKDLTTITYQEMHQSAEAAFKLTQTECDSSDFINDITKVSNLILEEGHEYHFIHKSVQEFYASNYIKNRPDEAAVKFYGAILGGKLKGWEQELNFLNQIDRFRYNKHLFIPSARAFFEKLGLNPHLTILDIQDSSYDKILAELKLGIETSPVLRGAYISYTCIDELSDSVIQKIVNDLMRHKLRKNFFSSQTNSSELEKLVTEKGVRPDSSTKTKVEISAYDYFDHLHKLEEIYPILNCHLVDHHKELINAVTYTEKEELSLDLEI